MIPHQGGLFFYTPRHGGDMAVKVPYTKQSLSIPDQVALLQSRGVHVPDQQEAEHFLRYHNFYQVSGYVYYFEVKDQTRTHRTHQLARPISFNDLISLVHFDQELRHIFFRMTTEIEIALRCSVAYRLSQAYGPFCFEHKDIFRTPEQNEKNNKFKEILQKACAAHEKEPFVAHFTRTYQESIPPVWVMVELLTLGNISWLKALTELRNTCAHHMRLWNKVFVNHPKIRKADQNFPIIQVSRLGSFLPMVFHLMHILHNNQKYQTELLQLLRTQPLIKSRDMGLARWPEERA
jgi:abortive infection bacteriophage resistance protein